MAIKRFRNIFQLLKGDMLDVNRFMAAQMSPILKLAKAYQFNYKRLSKSMLRSRLSLLGSKAFNYEGKLSVQIAAISELIHIAFLFHDLLCDPINYQLQKNETAVLLGDFVSSRAIQLTVEINNDLITRILSNTFNLMSEGQIIRVHYYNDPEITEEIYMEIIHHNYVSLISACAQLGAILANAQESEITLMGKYGEHLGTAYYLLKDYNNCIQSTSQCKLSFPLIYTTKNISEKKSQTLARLISSFKNKRPNKDDLAFVQSALNETRALSHTQQLAEQHIQKAIQYLHEIPTIQNRNPLLDFTHSIHEIAI